MITYWTESYDKPKTSDDFEDADRFALFLYNELDVSPDTIEVAAYIGGWNFETMNDVLIAIKGVDYMSYVEEDDEDEEEY